MSNNIQKGRRPLSQKTKPSIVNHDDVFMNPLGLDPEMIKVIESKGYTYRFINFKQFADMGGVHQAHWRPISRKQLKEWGYDTMVSSNHEFQFGSDVDGYIRRSDLVLAIRTKEINEKHKSYLRQEAASRSNSQKRHAEELKELVRDSNTFIEEGYGDDDET